MVLGGPAMLIGLGGGAASSMSFRSPATKTWILPRYSGTTQRSSGAARKLSTVAGSRGDANPIAFIHDVGAGGLSNALPELVKDGGRGGEFELRQVPNAEPGMSPLEIWCNEAQERYVLAVSPGRPGSICRNCAAASAVPLRWWARPGPTSISGSTTAISITSPLTCRWMCCSASRRRCIVEAKSRYNKPRRIPFKGIKPG